jgi:hypothetical protein
MTVLDANTLREVSLKALAKDIECDLGRIQEACVDAAERGDFHCTVKIKYYTRGYLTHLGTFLKGIWIGMFQGDDGVTFSWSPALDKTEEETTTTVVSDMF